MTLSLTLLIVSAVILIAMFAVRKVELSTGKFLVPKNIRFVADDFIKTIGLAVIRNIVKIQKLISREISIMPKRITYVGHTVWSKLRDKVDRFFEKMHKHHHRDLDNHKGSVSIYWKSVSENMKK